MQFIINNWLLILTFFVAGGMLVWPLVMRNAGGVAIAPDVAVGLINRDKAVVIDVSESAEFAAGHIGGAKHLAFGEVEAKIGPLVKDKTRPVLVACPTGARATKAAALLRKAGYEKAVPIAGGTAAWRTAQLPIEKSA